MATTTGGAKTVCPFYLRDYDRTIACEGLGADDEVLHRFRNRREKQQFQKTHCFRMDEKRKCGGWADCPIAVMVMTKYRDGDK